jgi:hypothetical protein
LSGWASQTKRQLSQRAQYLMCSARGPYTYSFFWTR